MALTTTDKILYHTNRAGQMVKKIKDELTPRLTTRSGVAQGAQPNCELEQTVLDAARILKEEACLTVELAQEDLDECLNG